MTSSPRIAMYIHRLIANPTGIQRYAVELASALSDINPGVTLVTGSVDTTDPGVRAALIDLGGPTRWRHLAWTALNWPRLERSVDPLDLVHMSSPAFPVPTKLPLVVTVHDLLPFESPEWYSAKERWTFRNAMSYAVDHAAAFLAPSEFVRREAIDFLGIEPSRITAIAEGVAAPLAAAVDSGPLRARIAELTANAPYVVAVGGLIRRKNLDVVIEAIGSLPPGATTPRLLIAGDGPDRARLDARVAQLADPATVRLLGRVDDAMLSELLRGALGLVHPALYEGFGLTTIEAMAADVPVLAADAGSLPEVVGDGGVLLPPTESTAWAEAITRLAGDPTWRDTLRAKGRARAATFSWEKAARETYEVYERVLAD